MNIHKIVNKLKSIPLPRLKKYTEIDGKRYYKINNHLARIEFDEELGMFVGVFENMRAMTCFYVYYESDIHSAGLDALRSYLAHCKNNNLDPYKQQKET
ncbi:hypothetical protein F3J37_01175 [Pantoea sp. Al-1710]|uniref:Phage protein n=1 Tax=Candidatus Pantoea communis TaxID=2608354 RepID=A0ABX0RI24_9GAMM|nr:MULTISPECIES: hypothetical protein [Pantoea]NIG13011.1 hypothetical protein [Pantoea sp. Cy-640]NIG17288.1 hypothetical protein [Pantoea communis]